MSLNQDQIKLVQHITKVAPCADVKFNQDNCLWNAMVESGDTIQIKSEFGDQGEIHFKVFVLNDDGMVEVEHPVNNLDELEMASFLLQHYFSEVFLGSTVFRIIRSFTNALQSALSRHHYSVA